MTEIELNEFTDLQNIVIYAQLKTIVVETGDKNVYLPNENKFIVTKDFLSNSTHVFANCTSLNKINMENFDFSEITIMNDWFARCERLQEIVFPVKADCYKLESLYCCFSHTNLKNIDLSFMQMKNNKISFAYSFSTSNAYKIVLPKCKIVDISGCFYECKNLEEIIAPVDIDLYKEDVLNIYTEESLLDTFYNCLNLKIVNLSDGSFNIEDFIAQITNPNNNNNLPKDCVIVLPNVK